MMSETLELFNTYRAPAQHLISILLAAAIWRWGAGPERWLIGVFLATMVAPIYVVHVLDLGAAEAGPFTGFYIAIDLVAALLFVAIALNANRNYPMWMAGSQLVALATHAVNGMVDGINALAFAILVVGPSYCQVLLLLIGFFRHVLRQRRYGAYREWREAPPGLTWVRL